MPLRILHVAPYSGEAWAYGGIPRVLAAQTRALAGRGHLVTVCATDACDSASRLGAAGGGTSRVEPLPATRDGDVEVRLFPNVSNRLAHRAQLFLPVGMGRFLRERAGSFDVAHLHACHNVPGALAARELLRAGVPFVLQPNGTAPRLPGPALAKWAFDATVGREVLPGAAVVIAVSEAERRQLEALGVRPDRVRLVPNPLDLDELEPPPSPAPLHGRLGASEVVLFLGQLAPRKGPLELVEAFARLSRPGAVLALAGPDMGSGDALERRAAELGLAGRVRRLGLVTGRERLELLAGADVVAYPSRAEAFGLVPLEALLCGTPVIVGDDGGAAEILADVGGGRTVPPGDVGALAAALSELLSAGPWREQAREAGARIRERFAATAVAARLEDLYLEVAGRPAGQPS